MQTKEDFYSYNTGHYFSAAARFIAWNATIFSFMGILNGSIASYFFFPIGFVCQFTHYRTEFDLYNRMYRVGIRLFGLTFGKMQHLAGVDFLYLNRNGYSQVAESRASMTKFRRVKYDGYINLADNKKLHLVKEDSKERALQRMGKISDDLGIELRDQTDMKFY